MADHLRIRRNALNEYRVRIRLGNHTVDALIDTGMTSPDCLIGVGLDSENYAAVLPTLTRFRRLELEAIGSFGSNLVRSGFGQVSIDGLDDSLVETYIAEIGENLLGVCYFQRLSQCELMWNPNVGTMDIRTKND